MEQDFVSVCCTLYLSSIFVSITNQPDRIRQFGLHRRRDHPVLELPESGGSETPSRGQAKSEKAGVRDREILPHEQPRVAFQSPLLDYFSSLGGGTPSPSSQPAATTFSGAMDPHR